MNTIKTPIQLLITLIILITCVYVILQGEDVLLREFCKGLSLISVVLMMHIIGNKSVTLK